MSIDRWLLIAVGVLLPLWLLVRIVMLPALIISPGSRGILTTYMRYRAEQRGKLSLPPLSIPFSLGRASPPPSNGRFYSDKDVLSRN